MTSAKAIQSRLNTYLPFNPSTENVSIAFDFLNGKALSEEMAIEAIDLLMGYPEDNESTLAATFAEVCHESNGSYVINDGIAIEELDAIYSENMPKWEDDLSDWDEWGSWDLAC